MGVLLVSMKVALPSNKTRRYPCVKIKRFKGLFMVESPDVFKIGKTDTLSITIDKIDKN